MGNMPCEIDGCTRPACVCRGHYQAQKKQAQAYADANCLAAREQRDLPNLHHDGCSYTKGRFDAENYSVPPEKRTTHAVGRAVAGLRRAMFTLSAAQRRQVLDGFCPNCLSEDRDSCECKKEESAPVDADTETLVSELHQESATHVGEAHLSRLLYRAGNVISDLYNWKVTTLEEQRPLRVFLVEGGMVYHNGTVLSVHLSHEEAEETALAVPTGGGSWRSHENREAQSGEWLSRAVWCDEEKCNWVAVSEYAVGSERKETDR